MASRLVVAVLLFPMLATATNTTTSSDDDDDDLGGLEVWGDLTCGRHDRPRDRFVPVGLLRVPLSEKRRRC